MGMHKILFGTIVFFSLAFLAACGGGGSGSAGSAGATGAAGDDGDDGAAGTISLPTDSDLALSVALLDNDSTKLEWGGFTINVVGLDNETVDSRLRYYAYLGSSATVKRAALVTGTAVTGPPSYAATGVIDSRMKPDGNDNLSIAFATGQAITGNSAGTGPRDTHVIICAGNEAGDSADCSSIAIADRLAHSALSLAGLTIAATSNAANISIAYGNGAFQVLLDNISASPNNGIADNASIAYTIAPATGTKAAAYAGTALSVASDNTSNIIYYWDPQLGTVAGQDNETTGLMISEVVFKGNDAYYITTDNASNGLYPVQTNGTDNLTVYKRTNGVGDWAVDNETSLAHCGKVGTSTLSRYCHHTASVIGSDGTDIFLVTDNQSALSSYIDLIGHVIKDNSTGNSVVLSSDPIRVATAAGGSATLTMCSTTTTDKMVIVVDNGTNTIATGSNFSAGEGVRFDVLELFDNGTFTKLKDDAFVQGGPDNASGLTDMLSCSLDLSGSTYILTVLENGGDNISVATSTDLVTWTLAYEEARINALAVKVSAAAPNGIDDVWVAVDDGVNVDLYHSDGGIDAGDPAMVACSSSTLVPCSGLNPVHSIATCDLGGIAHDGGASGSAKIGIACENGTVGKVDIYYE